MAVFLPRPMREAFCRFFEKEAMVETKAFLVGINAYPTMPLKGCLNDVAAMQELLTQRFNVPDRNIRVLRDSEATKAAIEEGLRWLAEPDDEPSSVRVFHFSGHGTYIEDQNGDEPDGRDEAIVPYDFTTVGGMADDVLRGLYDRFTPDTHLLLVMDCCHSGSIQRNAQDDVRYRFLPNSFEDRRRFDERKREVQQRRDAYVFEQLRDYKSSRSDDEEWKQRVKAAMEAFDKKHFGIDTVRGNVVLLSACRADQTAADAHLGGDYNGAFTYYLAQVLNESGGAINYGTVVEQVGRRLYNEKFLQIPQLECSEGNRTCGFLNVTL